MDFYTEITQYGLDLINNQTLAGTPFITDGWYISLGTGDLIPTIATTTLINKIYDKNSSGYLGITFGNDANYGRYAKLQVPNSLEGNVITELGLFDATGGLVLAAKTYIDLTKTFAQGIYKSFNVKMSIEAIPADLINLTINPSTEFSTTSQVNTLINTALGEFQPLIEKDVAGGYAGLDLNRKIIIDELPYLDARCCLKKGNLDANGFADILYAPGTGTAVNKTAYSTPAMTSTSQSGCSVSGTFGIFNTSKGGAGSSNGYHPKGTLTMGELVYITGFYCGTSPGINYVGRTATMKMYSSGTLGYSMTYNPRAYFGGSYTFPSAILCDTIELSSAGSAVWDGGAYHPGYCFTGYKLTSTTVSTATKLYFKIGGDYPNLSLIHADRTEENIPFISAIPAPTTSGVYSVLKEKGNDTIVTVLSSLLTEGRVFPTASNGAYHLLKAYDLFPAKKVSGAWTEKNFVKIGEFNDTSGLITAVRTCQYNNNRYNNPSAAFPDKTKGIAKSANTTYVAECDGWMSISDTGFIPISAGETYSYTSAFTFYPTKGVC